MNDEASPTLDEILDVVTVGSRVLVRIAARALDRAGADITVSQCRTLVALAQLGPLSLVGLADALAVNPSTASRMSDRLVAKGLVSRQRRDGGVSLAPTDAGLEVMRAVTRERRDALHRIVARLGEDDRRELVRCMEAFRSAAGELGEGQWAFGWWE